MSSVSESYSSTDSDSDIKMCELWVQLHHRNMTMVNHFAETQGRRHAYVDRQHEDGHNRLFNDYFSENPIYTDYQFRRRFRMRRHLFLRIVDRLTNEMVFFQQRPDATGRCGLSPLQKCTAAIRMLAYGVSADMVDDYVRIRESTTRQCLKNFVEGIISYFGEEYLRRPNPTDLQRLLFVGAERGFPGMMGSIDCMHWEWKNCPAAWKGQFARGDHSKPTIILEAVASYDLWIWHAFFGTPGTCNDINVLDRSPIFNDVLEGRAPDVNFVVNGQEYNIGYYLTNGIYPSWPTFIQSIRLPQGAKAKLFAQHQEAARKDVERAFGVLQARFAVIRGPTNIWDLSLIGKIMKGCITLHNMIVEDERDTYMHYYDISQFDQIEENDANWSYATIRHNNMATYIENRARLREMRMHQKLKLDLIDHVWQKFSSDQ